MGNQTSSGTGAGHVPARHRRDSDGPAVLPPHVPPGVASHVSGARERRHSETRDKSGPLDMGLARLRKLSGGEGER